MKGRVLTHSPLQHGSPHHSAIHHSPRQDDALTHAIGLSNASVWATTKTRQGAKAVRQHSSSFRWISKQFLTGWDIKPGLLVLLYVSHGATGATLDIDLRTRLRAEALENGFRPLTAEHDHANSSKTLLRLTYQADELYAVFEGEDARAWGFEPNSAVGTGFINTQEPLEAKIGWQRQFEDGAKIDLAVGRTTLHWQDGRLLGRQNFRTSIESYTGFTGSYTHTSGIKTELIAVNHNQITPGAQDIEALRSRHRHIDHPNTDVSLVGVNVSQIEWPRTGELALYLLHLDEADSALAATRDRMLWNAGIHVSGNTENWQLRGEASYQWGHSSTTLLPTDVERPPVSAGFIHTAATRHLASSLSITLMADYASGDSDPKNGTYTTYQPLWPSNRVGDFTYTGLYGPLKGSNLISPAAIIDWHPTPQTHTRLRYRPAWQQALAVQGGGLAFRGHNIEALFEISPSDSALHYSAGVGYFVPGGTVDQQLAASPGNSLYVFADIAFNTDWQFDW